MSEKESFTVCSWLLLYMVSMHTSCLLWGLTVRNTALFMLITLRRTVTSAFHCFAFSFFSTAIFFLGNILGIWVVNEEGLPVSSFTEVQCIRMESWKVASLRRARRRCLTPVTYNTSLQGDVSVNSAQGHNLSYRALPFREFTLTVLAMCTICFLDTETACLYVISVLRDFTITTK